MSQRERWIYASTPAGTRRMRLFCLPYAGGGAAIYRLWPDAVPADVEVCRIQLPGRESRLREPPFKRLDRLVETLLEVLGPYLDEPFALFGHSMGAQVGFELARACRREYGVEPTHLFVSGWRAPQLPREPHIHRLPEDALVREIRSRYGGIPDAVLREPELMALMIPVLRADLAVCESAELSPEPPLGCPISAYGGLGDTWVTREHLQAWGEHTREAFEVAMFAGDHFFVDSQRAAVSGAVAATLDATGSRMEPGGSSP